MSLKDLSALHSKITAAIEGKRVSERQEVRTKMEELARTHGFTIADLFGKGRKGGRVAPKYRNPKDFSQTWTGRGRRPRWIVEAGGDLKGFLIAS
jgi:DNA-binding protein H-NS